MTGSKKEYDLICSLGGNCSAAHNLLFRGLRKCAYPFDWTYFKTEDAIYTLAKGFKDNFKSYMLKDNLQEISSNPEHPDKVQYYDNYGKIIWANHFTKRLSENNEYLSVKQKFNKRFQRLVLNLEKAHKVMFCFSCSFDITNKPFMFLLNSLKTLYPDKDIEVKVILFACQYDEHFSDNKNGLEVFRYKRPTNNYDFTQTNQEWSFLDNVVLKENDSNINHQMSSSINTKVVNIRYDFLSRIHCFGKELYFCIGKKKDV